MTEAGRLSPEVLLKRVQEEERQGKRGKLKIYLGAAPGVGKTYTMLQDAMAKRAEGLDVVVGIVESHGREEIQALLKGLEVLPHQAVEYHGKEFLEFDLDAALKRHPAIILIDEMAHSNIPGLRHLKRWRDIKEILDRGIDVYTTLNVQHIESLNDVVSQIIQTRVKETVPDSALDLASTIELVDLPPEDLLKRLQEGKIYFPLQAEISKENFFRKGNLIALRELALRVTAERVEAEVFLYRQGEGIKRIWQTKEKILVCVGPGRESIRLIREARRMANSLHAEWLAVYVDVPRIKLTEEQRNNAIQYLRFAEQLGAETHILTGFDVVKEIMNFARDQNVTQIMLWKNVRPRWKDFLFKNLADEVVRNSHEINVYIVTPDFTQSTPDIPASKTTAIKPSFPWKIYGFSIGIIAIATGINFLLSPFLAESNLILVYLLGVTLIALFGRLNVSIFASILSVLVYDFFFIPPFFSFEVANLQYFLTLVVMLLVSMTISHFTILTRRQTDIVRRSAHRATALHKLSRQLASARGVEKLLKIATHYIADVFDSEVMVLLPENERLIVRATYRTENVLNIKEQSVAQWVYESKQMAGLGTDTLAFSEALYVPLLAKKGSMGVLRICPIESRKLLTSEQIRLLESCANQLALALESELK